MLLTLDTQDVDWAAPTPNVPVAAGTEEDNGNAAMQVVTLTAPPPGTSDGRVYKLTVIPGNTGAAFPDGVLAVRLRYTSTYVTNARRG